MFFLQSKKCVYLDKTNLCFKISIKHLREVNKFDVLYYFETPLFKIRMSQHAIELFSGTYLKHYMYINCIYLEVKWGRFLYLIFIATLNLSAIQSQARIILYNKPRSPQGFFSCKDSKSKKEISKVIVEFLEAVLV